MITVTVATMYSVVVTISHFKRFGVWIVCDSAHLGNAFLSGIPLSRKGDATERSIPCCLACGPFPGRQDMRCDVLHVLYITPPEGLEW